MDALRQTVRAVIDAMRVYADSGMKEQNWRYRLWADHLDAALAQQVPADGEWVLVPREATDEMYNAHRMYGDTSDWWNAVIAATPQTPQPTTDSVANRYESVAPQAPQPESREARMVVVERDANDVPTVWCDPEIADLVTALNAGGIRTIASCSGHGEQNGNIALADGRELIIAPDYESARRLEALALSMAAASQSQAPQPVVDGVDGVIADLRAAASLGRPLTVAEVEEIAARLASQPQQGAVEYQFQDNDGKWCWFHSERHRDDTIADGRWPIRTLYPHPPTIGQQGAVAWFAANYPREYVALRGPVNEAGESEWERKAALYDGMKEVVEAAGFDSITACVAAAKPTIGQQAVDEGEVK